VSLGRNFRPIHNIMLAQQLNNITSLTIYEVP